MKHNALGFLLKRRPASYMRSSWALTLPVAVAGCVRRARQSSILAISSVVCHCKAKHASDPQDHKYGQE
eukprot:5574114-Amphidinium_carterae.1